MYAPVHSEEPRFEVRFQSLFDGARALVFPCDALGRVDLDKLPARALSNYLYARALVGRDYATPTISRVEPDALSDASAFLLQRVAA